MDRRILFISKYPDTSKEFLRAMKERGADAQIQVDTASNGIEAAAHLKANKYQVVITGLSMDGYNGEQIITYLNKNSPHTVCIIYTTNISAAQLHFFINARSVFRVFLRPVDFQKEFYDAIEEAFAYYEVRVAEEEEEKNDGADIVQKEKELQKIRQRLLNQKQMHKPTERYMKRLLELSLQEYAGVTDEVQREKRKELEMEAAALCFGTEELQDAQRKRAEALTEQVKETLHG